MAHEILANGTSYAVSGGKALVSGTGYDIASGKTLVNGTAYDISFAKPISFVVQYSRVSQGTLTVISAEHFDAIEGMTWEEFINWNDKTKLYLRTDPLNGGTYVYYRGSAGSAKINVNPSDVIVDGKTYTATYST